MLEVYTNNGWEMVDPITLADQLGLEVLCCDCPEPATVITENGSPTILWAQCDGCSDESRACNLDALRQAQMECEI